jgi:hypothetical protein
MTLKLLSVAVSFNDTRSEFLWTSSKPPPPPPPLLLLAAAAAARWNIARGLFYYYQQSIQIKSVICVHCKADYRITSSFDRVNCRWPDELVSSSSGQLYVRSIACSWSRRLLPRRFAVPIFPCSNVVQPDQDDGIVVK